MGIAIALLLLAACSIGLLFFSKQVAVWHNRSLAEIANQEETLSKEYKELKQIKHSLTTEIKNIDQKIFLMNNEWSPDVEEGPQKPRAPITSPEEKATRWLLASGKITVEQQQKAQKLTGKIAQDFVETCIVLDFLDEKTITEVRRIIRTGKLPDKEKKAPK